MLRSHKLFLKVTLIAVLVFAICSVALASGTVLTVTPSGSGAVPIGDISNLEYSQTQSIVPSAGYVTQIAFYSAYKTGSPTGTIYLEFDQHNNNDPYKPGTAYTSTTTSAVANDWIVWDLDGTIYVNGTDTVWLTVYTDAQATDQYWTWRAIAANPYSLGQRCSSTNARVTWTCDTYDLPFQITTVLPTATITPTPLNTPTATPNTRIDATIPASSAPYSIDRTATFGDMAIVAALCIVAVIMIAHFTRTWIYARRDN